MDISKISTCMDVKLDIHDKRPESLKFRTWTRCEVKIEAIKCLPCFLRVSIKSVESGLVTELNVSINVPGLNISLATSRTKLYSYGLFWTHNRRNCFIYFALETELACRKHMKWLKKAMKNLDLHRQTILEQRRNSRGCLAWERPGKQNNSDKGTFTILVPLPQIPTNTAGNSSFNSFARVSDIYEEILEAQSSPRLSRRFSRSSIASGIYEEMKPCPFNFHSILEGNLQTTTPPPLPPLPPPRKRLNTFDNSAEGVLRRSRTNPESELIKKGFRHDRDVFVDENIGRAKRAESVGENPVECGVGCILSMDPPKYKEDFLKPFPVFMKANKRNSFSSPDLSKINLLEIFDELEPNGFVGDSAEDLFEKCGEVFFAINNHNISSCSLDDSNLISLKTLDTKKISVESLNVSEQLSVNFNFSACNSSAMNLVGASGAVPSSNVVKQNKIFADDLTGYCIMAPIGQKEKEIRKPDIIITSSCTSSTSSGYFTGSRGTSSASSIASSKTNSADIENYVKLNNPKTHPEQIIHDVSSVENNNDNSTIYENMEAVSPYTNKHSPMTTYENITPPLNKDFTCNLYENLLTFKAAQELEHALPRKICTSTPTEEDKTQKEASTIKNAEDEESYYQTPRKSLISVDEKIPSYYPNSCETLKTKRFNQTPLKNKSTFHDRAKDKDSSNLGLKNLVNIKMQRERKENLYMSSPQKIIEQRAKDKKVVNAQKISENVYAVKQNSITGADALNSDSNNKTEKSKQTKFIKSGKELIDLSLLSKIDFRFDDITNSTEHKTVTKPTSGIVNFTAAETEYERYFQASKNAARLLHKYATFAPKPSGGEIPQSLQTQHNQPHQQLMVQSSYSKLASSTLAKSSYSTVTDATLSAKKFTSLPRFKKFDLSPIKVKIHNVLQRHQ